MAHNNIRYAAGAVALVGAALWSAAVPATAIAQSDDPSTLMPNASRVEARTIVGQVASGSAGRYQLPDPGPYPNREECERARAKYYDPSQLECVPVRTGH
ncbi:hypothetical protein AW168_10720 [Nocardia brasiliensis]|uniref:Uncharacterized protein n=1 Tax=Nocardia brasiliensis (strain ATCC 700358 / HUJEG-1) TaxID=1133849 RepID=K0ER38_NOCB7|nr:hypothetical protein O3I_007605 [Nocardia brasiliensis ATCC 700358]OCF90442.1 hypothetical protein AW168_10720 [Nocardia brasiliensis]